MSGKKSEKCSRFYSPDLKVIFNYVSFCCDDKIFRPVPLGKVTNFFFCLENSPLKVTTFLKLKNLCYI